MIEPIMLCLFYVSCRVAEELIKADRIAHYRALKQKQDLDIQQLLHGPTVGSTVTADNSNEESSNIESDESSSSVGVVQDPSISFAEVTLMGGSFPTLASATSAKANSSSGNGAVGAWGKPKVEPKSAVTGSASSGDTGSVWARGAKVTGKETHDEPGIAGGGKKGKKFTKVSLLSNSSSRNYR